MKKLLTILIIGFFYHTPSWAQSPPDIENFFPKPQYGELDLSPSGKYVTMPDYRDEEHKVLVYNVETQKIEHSISMGTKTLNWVKWANDQRLLVGVTVVTNQLLPVGYYYRDDEGKRKRRLNVSYARALAIDMDGTNQAIMFSDANHKVRKNYSLSRLTDVLPNDPNHVLMRADEHHLSLYKVNINDGKALRVEKGNSNTYNWKINKNGIPVVRFESTYKSKFIKIRVRAPGEKKWKKIITLRKEDLDHFNPISQTENPKVYYVSARPAGEEHAGIYRYNLESKTFSEKISDNNNVDIHMALIDKNGDYYGSVYWEDKLTYDLLDKNIGAHIAGVDTFFNDETNVLIYDVSANGRIWLLYASGPQNPGSYYSYDVDNKKINFIIAENTELESNELGKVEIIKYKARDGLELNGYLTKPAKPHSHPAPLLVMPHGGPQARDYYDYDLVAQFFATRGYQVLQPNFRGSKGFGKTFEKAGYKKWGTEMIDDMTDAVTHLVKTGKVSPGKMCILGMSYGGYAALASAYREPDLYSCSISINGVSDLQDTVDHDIKRLRDVKEIVTYIKDSIGDPKTDKNLLIAQSPLHNIAKIKIPVLLLHGEVDDIVPVSQSRTFHAAMLAAGKSSKYIELADTDHNLSGLDPKLADDNDAPVDFSYAYKKTLLAAEEFLAEHLKP